MGESGGPKASSEGTTGTAKSSCLGSRPDTQDVQIRSILGEHWRE